MPTLRLLTWPDMPAREALAEAGRRLGVRVEATAVASNERLLALLDAEPYDLVFPSDYMVERLRSAGRLEPLPAAQLPLDHLAAWARELPYDPGCRHSVPFAFGTTGFIADDRMGTSSTWGDLFDPPGLVGMLGEVREVVGAALIACGRDPNATDAASLAEAGELLRRQRSRVARYDSDDFVSPVLSGDVIAHHAWSGPAAMATRRDSRLRYVVPVEGALLWVTTAAVPTTAGQPELACELIRVLMDPDLASLTTAWHGYATPNAKARQALPAALRNDEALFPTEETLARCHMAKDLGAEEERLLEVFAAVAETPASRN